MDSWIINNDFTTTISVVICLILISITTRYLLLPTLLQKNNRPMEFHVKIPVEATPQWKSKEILAQPSIHVFIQTFIRTIYKYNLDP